MVRLAKGQPLLLQKPEGNPPPHRNKATLHTAMDSFLSKGLTIFNRKGVRAHCTDPPPRWVSVSQHTVQGMRLRRHTCTAKPPFLFLTTCVVRTSPSSSPRRWPTSSFSSPLRQRASAGCATLPAASAHAVRPPKTHALSLYNKELDRGSYERVQLEPRVGSSPDRTQDPRRFRL